MAKLGRMDLKNNFLSRFLLWPAPNGLPLYPSHIPFRCLNTLCWIQVVLNTLDWKPSRDLDDSRMETNSTKVVPIANISGEHPLDSVSCSLPFLHPLLDIFDAGSDVESSYLDRSSPAKELGELNKNNIFVEDEMNNRETTGKEYFWYFLMNLDVSRS